MIILLFSLTITACVSQYRSTQNELQAVHAVLFADNKMFKQRFDSSVIFLPRTTIPMGIRRCKQYFVAILILTGRLPAPLQTMSAAKPGGPVLTTNVRRTAIWLPICAIRRTAPAAPPHQGRLKTLAAGATILSNHLAAPSSAGFSGSLIFALVWSF